MKSEIIAALWFTVGSVCLLVGTILNLINLLKK